jgi:ABC-type nitrate/sulfonate/bicarbonate transport system substrate-binding protein/nitrogen-specific signal transduction histidine kinase
MQAYLILPLIAKNRLHRTQALATPFLICLLVLVGMGHQREVLAGGASQPKNRPLVTVQLNWRHQFEFAAFYAAIEKGYYRDAGLEIRIREGGPDVDPVQEVLAGRADFGVANSSLVLKRARDDPVVALAALMQHSAFALLARRDRGIENVGDLDGRIVACAPHACDEIRAYLAASGLQGGHVRYVKPPSFDVAETLKVSDAVDIYSTNQSYQVRGHESEYVLLTPRSAGIDLYGDILFTTKTHINNARPTVEAFRDATIRGLTYALKNQDELVDLILERYNSQRKSREHLEFEAQKLYELIRPDLVDPGYMSVGRWEHVRDVYASLGMIPANFPVQNFIYHSEHDPWPLWLRWTAGILAATTLLALLISVYLRRINRSLKNEVRERERAELALQAEQDGFRRFVEQANSLVAHELRNPLATLKVHLDLLQLKQTLDAPSETNLCAMKLALLRLETLLEKNLEQVFSTTNFFRPSEVLDLRTAVETVVANQNVLCESSRISFRPPNTSLSIKMAPDMFDTLLANLLENALKYSPENTIIEVQLGLAGEFGVIQVSNRSLLPLVDDPESLFERHQRGVADTRQPGTGVGLYLVRLIAGAHGGHVHIRVERPDRFVVELHLPVVPDDQAATDIPPTVAYIR